MTSDIFRTPLGYVITLLPIFIITRMIIFFLRYWTHEPIKKNFVTYTLVIITVFILYGNLYSYMGVLEYLPVLAFLCLIDLVIIVLKIMNYSLPNINNLLTKKKLLPKGER
jgi:hypothetical protein